MGSVRGSFLLDVLGLVERHRGAGSLASASNSLPERIRLSCSKDALAHAGPTGTVPVADCEELLQTIDAKLGDGSGRFLEELATEQFSRTLGQSGGSVIVGDLFGTLARMRVPFEHPFVDMPVRYELARTPSGLSLDVGAQGHPRLTRLLRHLATGAVHAAQRFARAQAPNFRVYGETRGDGARIDVVMHTRSEPPPSEPREQEPPRRSTRPLGIPVKQASLSKEVDAILSRRAPIAAPDSRRPPSSTGYSVQAPEHGEEETIVPSRTQRPSRPGSRPGPLSERPSRPGTLPEAQAQRPSRPGTWPAPEERPSRPSRPGSRPEISAQRPRTNPNAVRAPSPDTTDDERKARRRTKPY
ncbi:MAG: hypothetical protein R3B13_03020 [Polyangiaceae bacterium]